MEGFEELLRLAEQGDAEAKSLLKELESGAQSNLGIDTAAANKFHADTARANELFVEAAKLVSSAENAERLKKAAVLEEALSKLNEIGDDYPSTELAVKLLSGQNTGSISLKGVGEAIEEARPKLRREAEEEKETELRAKFERVLKAAEQGDLDAQTNLGHLYSKDGGPLKSIYRAFKWYRKAAEQGHAEAQYELGVMYEYDEAVPKDQAEAVKWFRKAADQGHKYAKEQLKELEAK